MNADDAKSKRRRGGDCFSYISKLLCERCGKYTYTKPTFDPMAWMPNNQSITESFPQLYMYLFADKSYHWKVLRLSSANAFEMD